MLVFRRFIYLFDILEEYFFKTIFIFVSVDKNLWVCVCVCVIKDKQDEENFEECLTLFALGFSKLDFY